ncbi:tRNA lysidine(34) synthetase TilS [Hoeflea sp. AS60]|uniref:tRNA lysidine(34) synthetase TilS n=1 Tax=Hoeflea sp. AS60 TaxID=3135780 RepID=UPI0031786040
MPDVSGRSLQAPQQFLKRLSEFHAGLTDHRPLGVAVSGGSDSLGLLYGLAEVVSPGKLVALTVDHGLRAGSANEARWVKSRCRRLGIRHETLRWESAQPGTGLQAAARAARYRLLVEASTRLGLSAVLTAHTRDDQNETLAMRRARSSSDDAPGLAGIPPATLFEARMWVLRPLLALGRAEIRGFLQHRGVSDWVEDPSNTDPRFERVRVRARLRNEPAPSAGPDGAHIAVARLELARKVAGFIETNCHVDADDLLWMRYSAGEASLETKVALEALIDWRGGASRPLDRRGKATLEDFMTSCAEGRDRSVISLGRTLVRRRGDFLTVRRERRDIARLVLEPGAWGQWDRRFRVHNLANGSALTVSGGGNGGVLPCFSRDRGEWSEDEGVAGGFFCQPLVGRNSYILPFHQLPLAQVLARLAKLKSFPTCPWPGLMDVPLALR